jgi:hypothetical protein
MDEIRLFRFFIPIALFIVSVFVLSPATLQMGVELALDVATPASTSLTPRAKSTESDDVGSRNLGILPAASLIAIGASAAIALGFVNSTIVNAILLVFSKRGRDHRVQVDAAMIEKIRQQAKLKTLPKSQKEAEGDAIVCSAFQHLAPEPLKEFMGRRWEMFVVSVNSMAAIGWALVVVLVYGHCEAKIHPLSVMILLCVEAALAYSACRSRSELGAMTDYLVESDAWKWPARNDEAR